MTDPYGSPSGGYGPPGGSDPQDYFAKGEPAPSGYGVTPQGYGPPPVYGQAPQGYGREAQPYDQAPTGGGPIGQVRGTGLTILLFIVTLGIWGFVWYYSVHDEMKRHTGEGLGGVIALVLAIFVGIASPFLVSDEVGKLYRRRGQQPPVTALTGLWYFPGMFLVLLPIVWFVRTNGALNDYWRSLGATG